MKTVFELLNPDNTISVNRRLAHALGLSEAVIYAALLAKHAWYEQHGKLSDGWFYSTVDDMEESTSLTKCQQSRCVKRLVSAGLIRCAAKGLPARRFFYIVDDPQLLEGIIGVCEPSPEENAPAVRSETSPQEVRKSDSWQSGITAAGSAESSQKTKDNKTNDSDPDRRRQTKPVSITECKETLVFNPDCLTVGDNISQTTYNLHRRKSSDQGVNF